MMGADDSAGTMIPDAEALYVVSLVVANVSTAALMFLLGNPVFTVLLCALGVVVLAGATLPGRTGRPSDTQSPVPEGRM
jgi:hypothetical protein